VGSNPRNVDGGDRKGIWPLLAPELQQSLPVNQGANSTTRSGNIGSIKQLANIVTGQIIKEFGLEMKGEL